MKQLERKNFSETAEKGSVKEYLDEQRRKERIISLLGGFENKETKTDNAYTICIDFTKSCCKVPLETYADLSAWLLEYVVKRPWFDTLFFLDYFN